MDVSGEYVASSSDDGVVYISGLYTDEDNVKLQVNRPIKVCEIVCLQVFVLSMISKKRCKVMVKWSF